ncbi:MAG: nuclear transport factor 2 family protein [Hyphomicrobiales bacterium]|nr:nuclear transport factor 2 family protein [Hyphomicrobiales bacterium]
MDNAVITELLAEREVSEQLLNYCRGLDRLDRELLASVWHTSGTADYGNDGRNEPANEVIEKLIQKCTGFVFHHHNVTHPLLRIEGDKAVSETSVIAIFRKSGEEEGQWHDEHQRIRFLDQWSRRDGRWAIDHRIAIPTIVWEQSAVSGITGTLTRRDRTDPGYAHLNSLGDQGMAGTQAAGLPELRAERDIRRLLATYSRGIDRFDPDIWKSAWHDDATLSYETGQLDGVAHDMAFLMTFGHHQWVAHQHQSTLPSIRVCGDRAVSETLNFAMLHGYNSPAGISVQDHYRGRYLDTWEKRNGKWALDNRFTPRGCMWQQTVRSEVGAFMRRDRSDPSYEIFASFETDEQDDLAILIGERAIRAQLQTYCRALDRLDAALLRSVWSHGGTLVDRTRAMSGDALEMNDFILGELGNLAASMHHTTLAAIDINRDRAVSETYFENILIPHPDKEGKAVNRHVRGRYLDRWSQREGIWALEYREILLDFAWEQQVTILFPFRAAIRDLMDPSYSLFTGELSLI